MVWMYLYVCVYTCYLTHIFSLILFPERDYMDQHLHSSGTSSTQILVSKYHPVLKGTGAP